MKGIFKSVYCRYKVVHTPDGFAISNIFTQYYHSPIFTKMIRRTRMKTSIRYAQENDREKREKRER